jgi:hypothetical protein
MDDNFSSWFFRVCLLWYKPVSWPELWVLKISLIWFQFFLGFFHFYHSILDYWAFNFVILVAFFFCMGLSWSHILVHGSVELTSIDSGLFMFFFSVLLVIVILFFLYEVILTPNRAANLARLLESSFMFSFKIDFFFQFDLQHLISW